jgi:hypothetical protein
MGTSNASHDRGGIATRRELWLEGRYETTNAEHVTTKQPIAITVGQMDAIARERVCGFSRFNSIPMLARRLIDMARYTVVHTAPPSVPFSTLYLNSFDIVPPPSLPEHPNKSLPALRILGAADAYETDDEDESEAEEKLRNASEEEHIYCTFPVDGRPSCAYHLQCTLHPRDGSRFCDTHHEFIVPIQGHYERLYRKEIWRRDTIRCARNGQPRRPTD